MKRSPRLYFVGAHDVGKSTLVRWASTRYGLPIVHEIASEIASRYPVPLDKLRLDVDGISSYQREVFREQIAREAAHGDGGFVSDRAFDNLGYLAEHGEGLADVVESEECQRYVASVRERGIVFFVRPHGAGHTTDGRRAQSDLNLASQARIDGMILWMLGVWRVPYFEIASSSQRDRQRFVESIVKLATRG